MDQSTRNRRYYPGLDGLRAIAILGIVLYHMFPDAVRGGYLGVTMFFVLSGYLLSRTGVESLARGSWSTPAFYQKRIRRIYPALLWVLALTLLALRLWLPDSLVGIRSELGSILFGYENWHQILESQDYFSRITATSPFTHMWSLAVELQYYLVWPLLLGLYRAEQGDDDKWGTIGILIALAVASAGAMAYLYYATGDPSRSYYGTDTRVHALLLGGAIGMIPPERLRCSKGLGGTLFALGAAGYLALSILLDGASPYAYYGLIALAALLSAVLIVLCAQETLPFGRMLGWKPLQWLGQRSYEIYLTMYPVLYVMERLQPIENAIWRHLAEGGDAHLAEVPDDTPSPEAVVAAQAELHCVEQALASLPERQRIAIEMYRLGGFKLREIADRLSISVSLTHLLIAQGLAECHRQCRMDTQP